MASVRLRDFRPNDCDQVLAWRNSPDVAMYMYGDHDIGLAEHRIWFTALANDNTKKYWVIEAGGVGLGVAYVFDIDRNNQRASWGFYIGNPELRGAGVGYFVEVFVLLYVFEHLGLNKLCCEVLADNESVWQMHEKFGFTVEGRLHAHIRKNGAYRDVIVLGMLASQWQEIKPKHLARLERRGQILPDFTVATNA